MTTASDPASRSRGDQRVMTRRISKKAAAIGVAAMVGIGGGAAGVAYAYPSGVPITVSASATKAVNGQSTLTVTLGNADPRCSTNILVDGKLFTTLTGNVTTFSGPIAAGSGRHRVRARTVDCDLKENARSEFVVPDAAISGPTTGQTRQQLRYTLSGLEPGTTVTVRAILAGGGDTYTDTDVVDRRGNAKVKFKVQNSGTYAITAQVNGSDVASTSVTVN